YSNGIKARGSMVFTGGLVGWDNQCRFVAPDLTGQVRQALHNIIAVLAEAGAGPQHVVRMTWYVTDKREYLAQAKGIGAVYREVMGRNFPAMALVQVAALVEDEAKVEIEATAVIPDPD
ncbi:MAG: RidA family protein, partial [Proteobacteria bacterium]|nr:RidA family protein [Pseudomonadota bacterium]